MHSQLLSSHLYCVCQALDLRYLEFVFRAKFDPTVATSVQSFFGSFLSTEAATALSKKLRSAIWRRLEQTPSVDLEPRWDDAFSHVTAIVVEALTTSTSAENPLPLLAKWRAESAAAAVALTREVREAFWAAETSPTVEYLGKSRALYSFVRETVGVKARRGDVFLGKQEATIGSSISKIYDSVKSGRINSVLVEIMA